jgi:hypothetical protein
MLIDTQEYIEHLSKEAPEFNFVSLEKVEDYKNESEIYEVNFTKEIEGKIKEYSYRMLVGYLEFTKEEQMQNFVDVARLTYRGKNKEEVEEAEKEKNN